MSFLSRQAPNNAGGINQERIETALTEIDTITDFFNRMVNSCHAKCISKPYLDDNLAKGEAVCIDRCVAKFDAVQKRVGEKLQNRGGQQQNNEASSFGSL